MGRFEMAAKPRHVEQQRGDVEAFARRMTEVRFARQGFFDIRPSDSSAPARWKCTMGSPALIFSA